MNGRTKIIVPGYGGSGEGHWQTHWQAGEDGFARIEPHSFDEPDLSDWLASLESSVALSSGPPILVAHSLGCLLVAEFLHRSKLEVAGVFMVAVPDPEGSKFPIAEASDFANFSRKRLLCSSLIISSSNDPYSESSFTEGISRSWDADVVNVGKKGHINDIGTWNEGRGLLTAFCAGIG